MTEIKALLGCTGEVRDVLGCVSQLEDGRYFLEDLTGVMQLDLSQASTAEGFYTGMQPSAAGPHSTCMHAALPVVMRTSG